MLNRAPSASQALSLEDSTPQTSTAGDTEYAALETTLKSSELGRRFLADYARQHPTPEIKLLLNALARLEPASQQPERKAHTHGIVSELVAMSETISEMRRDIGALCLTDLPDNDPIKAPCAFEHIVEASAQATSDVLTALEEIQNVSLALREKGIALESCEKLDASAIDIYTACARREIAGQQTADALNLLRDMERRIDALIEHWSDHETQNLLNAAKALDVSEAFQKVVPGPRNDNAPQEPAATALGEHSPEAESDPDDCPQHAEPEAAKPEDPKPEVTEPQDTHVLPRRTNRLVPEEEFQDGMPPASDASAPTDKAQPAELPDVSGPLFDEPRPFERAEPLTLEKLIAAQRTALFG